MSKKKDEPKNPDPLTFVCVRTKEGVYFRRKRGTVKPATINDAFAKQSNDNGSAEAKKIADKLMPYLEHMDPGRKIARIGAQLRKSKTEHGQFDYRYLKNFEIQKRYPLHDIYTPDYDVLIERNVFTIHLKVSTVNVKARANYITGFYFEIILVAGNLEKGKLRTESDMSDIYDIEIKKKFTCTLSIHVPEKQPWFVLLKVGSIKYETEPGHYGKLYGMQVIATSFDETK